MLTGPARRPGAAAAPPPGQVHVQFGADASAQAAVSWAAPGAVARPRLLLGPACEGAGKQIDASERIYTDALTGQTVFAYHASSASLEPGTRYAYQVLHDGCEPVGGTFTTAPRGRQAPFRFTSFGDQSVPAPVGLGHGPNSPNAAYVVDSVERLDPLFHLVNGDLCYANASEEPVDTWSSWFANVSRSARLRPWMPTAGNHENEPGNGPQGYLAYQTRFELPGNGSASYLGNWYAFTAGSVRFIALNNDDVCLQDGGFSSIRRDHAPGYEPCGVDPYIHGYSGGAQRRWLERELATARADDDIDWIVVFMHQVAISTTHFNGADLGIRQQWLPLFDAYGVDLVLTGHEHHYERTFPLRGVLPGSDLLTPAPAADAGSKGPIDTRQGTVHMTVGGGGHPYAVPGRLLHGPGEGVVIAAVGPGSPRVTRRPVHVAEPAPWSAYRETQTTFGFASFDVEPAEPGATTSITVTYWGAANGSPRYRRRDRFVLRKPLPSGWQSGRELAGRTMAL